MAGDVHDLQLNPIRVVEEDGVVPRLVPVLLRPALDFGALAAEPLGPLVDRAAGKRLETEVVEPDLVAVEGFVPLALSGSQSDSVPGPLRYQIVSPRSPATSPTRCQPRGPSNSR